MMNQRSVLSRRRLLLSVLAGALLTGCGGPGPVYPGPETLPLLDGSRTRSITPENPTGEPVLCYSAEAVSVVRLRFASLMRAFLPARLRR